MTRSSVPQQREALSSLAFFGGGTGGHLFPAIAIAERAVERFPGCRVLFVRTGRPVEDQVFSDLPYETRTWGLSAPGRAPGGWARYLLRARLAAKEARTWLRQGDGFDVVFGLGGYVSLPGVLAARAEGIAALLLEQNRVAGRVNRLLAPWADAVLCSYADTQLRFGRRVEVTGNPVRRDVLAAARRRAETRVGDRRAGIRTVLVMGGSQGSHAINGAICTALPELRDLRLKIRWIHLTGPADKETVKDAYRKNSWDAEVIEFTDRLPYLVARSDLVLARSGGTTVSELAVLGVPAILIPYPHHRDGHQVANAQALVEAGGAQLLAEEELSSSSLRRLFTDVLFSPQRLSAMARGALGLARPRAADAVLDLAVELRNKRCRSGSVSSS